MRFAATLALCAACTVGPKYELPPAAVPSADHYKEAGRIGPWRPASPADAMLRGPWWKVFKEPELDALIARIDLSNQNVAQAFANFMAARAQIHIAQSQYFPTLVASPSVSTGRFGGGSFQNDITNPVVGTTGVGAGSGTVGAGIGTGSTGRRTVYSLPLDASWAPDLFGRVRNTVKQARANAQASAADLEGMRLLQQATLATTYFQIRGQDALIDLLEETVEADQKLVDLARSRFTTGVDTELALIQSQQALQSAKVQLTDAGILRAQFEHAIATLIGVPAGSFALVRRGALPTPPAIPTGAPSRLLERRPDIAGAERRMAAANAAIGIAYAAYFPDLELTASGGFASTAISTLLDWPSRVWSVGAALSETLFDGGLRKAQVAQARALYDANVAGYRQIVLTAFQQVEDALADTIILSQEIEQQKTAVALAERALAIEQTRYTQGLDPYINLLQEQQLLLAARQTLVGLQVQQMASAVALVQALGGGWERSDLSAAGTSPTGTRSTAPRGR